jgi:anti-sigma regulatory factor (Ser/Thr protein kinase)
MSRRADVVQGSRQVVSGPELRSGVGPASTDGHVISAAWPLRSHLELGALADAVPSARLHARLVVTEWELSELAEVVELVVSELVTNGVKASAGLTGSRYNKRWRPGRPPVRLWVQSDHERVLVQVWDGNDRAHVRQDADPEAESGRGLLLVETLSEACGVYQP